MPYIVDVTVDYRWVGPGMGSVLMGVAQANDPGFGATGTPGSRGNAQTARDQVSETVPGGASPSAANFGTAMTQAATDLQTRLSTAGLNAFTGQSGTLLSVIQGWATGAQ